MSLTLLFVQNLVVLHSKSSKMLWTNAVKALLFEIWFERKQVFHNKQTTRRYRLTLFSSMLYLVALFPSNMQIFRTKT